MLPIGANTRPWASMSPIQALVERACDATLPEPNYAVNVELSEYINRKKANSAREATKALLVHINSRNPNQSLLALTLLDHLVHSCGYALHLQISTKEFLNELVRRFPERPPMITGRVMGRILELIHEWKNTLCVHSKYKEDLVHIRDMHRLLSYKGYRFKSFDATRAMASANPNENLKSPEELEEEDRAAKSAKLQELIRRGTPRDLAAAQELMKALAGAEPDKTPDYTSQTLHELDKVQQKAILLNDMLNNAHPGEKVGVEGDVYDQVAGACKGARPRIQKWIEEDGGEREGMMDRLLLCNDLINNALDRFEACKAGDWTKAQALVDSTNPTKPPDLIQFDAFADEEPLSGDGGLSLPTDPYPSSSSTSNSAGGGGGGGGMTSSGIPLDLFSAPSPGPGSGGGSSFPGLGGLSGYSGAAGGGGGVRQNPMDFFKSTPSYSNQQPQNQYQPQPQQSQPQQYRPQQQQQTQQNSIPGYSLSPTYPQTTQSQSSSQLQFQSPAPGYSLSPQPLQPQQPSQSLQSQSRPQALNGNGNGIGSQPAKKDAFADLVDLMS